MYLSLGLWATLDIVRWVIVARKSSAAKVEQPWSDPRRVLSPRALIKLWKGLPEPCLQLISQEGRLGSNRKQAVHLGWGPLPSRF